MPGEERSDLASHRLGALQVQEVTDAIDRAALDAGDRGAKQIVDLDPERLGIAAEHRQRRLDDERLCCRHREERWFEQHEGVSPEHHAPLADHLERVVRTSTHCAYLPDPRVAVTWAF